MTISLDRASQTPLHAQIAHALRDQIGRGDLAPGARLPSSRDLADQLGVNRATVVQSFRELREGGWIESGVGRGSFVIGPVANSRADGTTPGNATTKPMPWTAHLVSLGHPAEPPRSQPGNGASNIPLARAVAHPDLFPVEAIREAWEAGLARLGSRLFEYAPPAGYAPLREALRQRLKAQGIDMDQNEVIVVNGSQQGLDLVARLLLRGGGGVVTSRPAFAGALEVFRLANAEVHGVPVDAHGLQVEALAPLLQRRTTRLIYTVPSRHNPTGLDLDEDRRRALLELSHRHQVPLLEDDWLADLREEHEAPSLKSRDTAGHVLYLGTSSKVLVPGFRIGWLVVPRALAAPLYRLKRNLDLGTNLPGQVVLTQLLENGTLDAHAPRLRRALRRRRQITEAAIEEFFPEECRPLGPHHGMVLWIHCERPIGMSRVVEEACRQGVEILDGQPFVPDAGTGAGFRLSYATAEEADLRPALERLGGILKEALALEPAVQGQPLV